MIVTKRKIGDSTKRSAGMREKKRMRRNGRETTRPERTRELFAAPFLSIESTGAAKGNTLYMPTTFPKCSVQFFAATSAASSLWRVTQRHRGRRKGETTRTCSLAYAFLRASTYTCIHARPPLLRACVRCVRACAHVRAPAAAGSRGAIAERKGKREKREIYLPEFRWPPPAVVAPLPKNASRIRDLSRNMPYGGCPLVCCFSAAAFNVRFALNESVPETRGNIRKVFATCA